MAKRANKKAEDEQKFETPKDGDRILITFEDHRSSWYGPFFYHEQFVDPVAGKIHGAIIYAETWQKHGQLAYRFEQLEFWCRWEGESLDSYQERQAQIVAELRRQNVPIDPIDSFIGKNSIQGEWSPPKIGPSFKLVPVEGSWTRPKNGAMIEVHALNQPEPECGIFLQTADRIYSKDRLIETHNLLTGEVTYDKSDRYRYGVPCLPFAGWIRFRNLGEDRKPSLEWLPGPHYEVWKKEEEERMRQRTEEEKNIHFLKWSKWIDDEIHNASNTAERIVFLRNQLKAERIVSLPESGLRIDRLETRLKHWQEVLTVEKEPFIAINATEEFPALKYPFLKQDLYEVVKSIEPQLSFETFCTRLSRGKPEGPRVEGIPIEIEEIAGVPRISRKSFEAAKAVIEMRLNEKKWQQNVR